MGERRIQRLRRARAELLGKQVPPPDTKAKPVHALLQCSSAVCRGRLFQRDQASARDISWVARAILQLKGRPPELSRHSVWYRGPAAAPAPARGGRSGRGPAAGDAAVAVAAHGAQLASGSGVLPVGGAQHPVGVAPTSAAAASRGRAAGAGDGRAGEEEE